MHRHHLVCVMLLAASVLAGRRHVAGILTAWLAVQCWGGIEVSRAGVSWWLVGNRRCVTAVGAVWSCCCICVVGVLVSLDHLTTVYLTYSFFVSHRLCVTLPLPIKMPCRHPSTAGRAPTYLCSISVWTRCILSLAYIINVVKRQNPHTPFW